MNEIQHVLKHFPEFKGKFLALGEWSDVTKPLLDAGWTGVIVDHLADALSEDSKISDGGIYVHGPIDMAPHYIEVGPHYKMRAVTFREMLDTFPGPFHLVIISVPGLGKDLATAQEMWTAWPRVICVRSEGREQEIVNLANAHSYNPSRVERDALILVRAGK